MNIGLLIKQRRQQKGYTQVKLSAVTNVSLPTIQNLEAGKANPTLTLLERIKGPLEILVDIRSGEPDWKFLQAYGLPLETAETSKNAKSSPFSYFRFSKELLCAVDYVSLSHEERLKEAVGALLSTLQTHYPTFFGYGLAEPKVLKFIDTLKKTGRLIKLKRLALAKISKIM